MKNEILITLSVLLLLSGCSEPPGEPVENKPKQEAITMAEYYFPAEDAAHEGTWLNWPHHHTYGVEYRQELEPIWVEMTAALCGGERVHIVVYDKAERERVAALLTAERVLSLR